MSSKPPVGFLDLLRPILAALENDVGVAPKHVEILPSAFRASLVGDTLTIPEGHVRHWSRFGNLPTALIRDVAYSLKKQALNASARGASVEADAMAYAERFLRFVTEPDAD